jgi:hypothetical protein
MVVVMLMLIIGDFDVWRVVSWWRRDRSESRWRGGRSGGCYQSGGSVCDVELWPSADEDI